MMRALGVPVFGLALAATCFVLGCQTEVEPHANPARRVENAAAPAAAKVMPSRKERLPEGSAVAWRSWSREALAEAKAEAKPIFLHLRDGACHWCDLMAVDAFRDPQIAQQLETSFYPIFVDRDARPDVAAAYGPAAELLSPRLGWPMNLVLTPEGLPYGAVPYLPANSTVPGRPDLSDFLSEALAAWLENNETVRDRAIGVVAGLREQEEALREGRVPDAAGAVHVTLGFLKSGFDQEFGGFGSGAKFPRPTVLDFLLRSARRAQNTDAGEMLERTLDSMAASAFRDQLGGGFHRHTRDRAWRRPELEKTLEDNSQLALVYMDAARFLGREAYASTAASILDDVDRSLSAEGGGFYSSVAATSRDEDGKPASQGAFYTWSGAELDRALSERLREVFDSHLGLSGLGGSGEAGPSGQGEDLLGVEGREVAAVEDRRRFLLAVDKPLAAVAVELGLDLKTVKSRWQQARHALHTAREQRPKPPVDAQVVAAFNGLAISAFARASQALRERRYLQRAAEAAEFLEQTLWDGESLMRLSWREGVSGVAVIDDYALVATGLLDLFVASADERWLLLARKLVAAGVRDFWDEERGAFFAAQEAPAPGLGKSWPLSDETRPSANATMVKLLHRMGALTGDARYEDRAARILNAFGHTLTLRPIDAPGLVAALESFGDMPVQAAVLVPADGSSVGLFEEVVARIYAPNTDVIIANGERLQALSERLPWLGQIDPERERAGAWVCRDKVCGIATRDPEQFAFAMGKTFPLLAD